MNPLANEPQGRVSPIVRDFETLGIPADVTMDILLRRGVFKALAMRRALIAHKHDVKAALKGAGAWLTLMRTVRQQEEERSGRTASWRSMTRSIGRQRALLRQLQQGYLPLVRIARMDRASAPDHDRAAQRFLAAWLAQGNGDASGLLQVPETKGVRGVSFVGGRVGLHAG